LKMEKKSAITNLPAIFIINLFRAPQLDYEKNGKVSPQIEKKSGIRNRPSISIINSLEIHQINYKKSVEFEPPIDDVNPTSYR